MHSPLKSQKYFSGETGKLILKFIWNFREPQIAKTILKKNNTDYLILPIFKIYNRAIIAKTVWHLRKNRQIAQWDRIEPRQTHAWSNDFQQGCQKSFHRKRTVFLTNDAQKTGNPHCQKKKKVGSLPYTIYKN